MTLPKILIVEDESIVALDLKSKLTRLGYEVVGTASSGLEAINLTAMWRPELALMDIHLKGAMDGIETAHHLRDEFNTPVIYLSAHADDATLRRAVETEPFGYLTKPFAELELHSTLDMALYKIKMEKRLQRQAAQLLNIVTAIPMGVALLDSDYRLAIANPLAQDFLSTITGAVVGDVIDRLGEYSIGQLCENQETRRWHEIAVWGPVQRVFEAIVMPVSSKTWEASSDEALCEKLIVIRDVTADREVQQRAQSQDRLAAIGQFSAGIAHDFNNIISGIIMSAQVIKMTEPNLSPRVEERLESIRYQAWRASDLIKQILDFSRASAVSIQTFELEPMLKELNKMLDHVLPANIRFEIAYPPEQCWVEGDTTRILQVLMNLVLNSRDAMPHGGNISVEMAHYSGKRADATNLKDQREWTQIMVTDNGAGIAPDILPHIFEPFFTTKAPGQGTGLGLAQVYGIIQQHGGHINVDSQQGQGTTFSIYLPAVYPLSSGKDSFTGQQAPLPQGNRQTILIAEDNLIARQTLYEILELLDYRVFVASQGREALEILTDSTKHIDLLLCDLQMPEMGGVDLMRELRRRNIDLKTIILTGYTSPDDLASLHDMGITRCLNKPVDIERLSQCIEESLLEVAM